MIYAYYQALKPMEKPKTTISVRFKAAKDRYFHLQCVVFDTWYVSIEHLNLIHSFEWHWFSRLKSNRLVNPDHATTNRYLKLRVPPKVGS